MLSADKITPSTIAYHTKSYGFTLVEILIVIVILGIISAIVIPSISNASGDATKNSFATSLKTFHEAVSIYRIKTGEYPPATSSGVVPSGLEDYVNDAQWTQHTPMGGYWDVEFRDSGTTCWVGVHFADGSSTYPAIADMQEIDTILDDGNLSTGAFIRFGPCQYYMKVE